MRVKSVSVSSIYCSQTFVPSLAVFCPTDAAIAGISDVLPRLDFIHLAGILGHHIVWGAFNKKNLTDAGCTELRTVSGTTIVVNYEDGDIFVNDSMLIQADMIDDVSQKSSMLQTIYDLSNPCSSIIILFMELTVFFYLAQQSQHCQNTALP